MAVALFWSTSVFSEFRMDSFETGNDLYKNCSDSRSIYFENYCKGYAVGVADAIMAVSAMKANGYPVPSVCISGDEHIKSEQVRDVVMQWPIAHPERRHQAAAGDALLALSAAFPCK